MIGLNTNEKWFCPILGLQAKPLFLFQERAKQPVRELQSIHRSFGPLAYTNAASRVIAQLNSFEIGHPSLDLTANS